MTKLISSAMLVALLAAACGGSDEPSIVGADPGCPTDGEEMPNPRPSSTAEVTITNPTRGQVVQGDSVVVAVEVEGACILEQAQTRIRPDTGHVHVALDGQTITLLAGTQFEVTDLTPGTHVIEVEFSAADHNPFNPRVLETVSFQVVQQ